MKEIEDTDADVCLGHLEVAGFRMYKGSIAIGKLDPKTFQKFSLTCSGHYHHKSSKGNIHYLGNTYGMTWADYDDPRGFHILDTETLEMEFIRNPYEIFHKVWYDDEDKELNEILDVKFDDFKGSYVKVIVTNKTNPYHFDRFLDELYKSDAQNIQIVDDHHHMDDMSEEDIMGTVEDTMTVLKNSAAELGLTKKAKKSLDKCLEMLYNGALDNEVV